MIVRLLWGGGKEQFLHKNFEKPNFWRYKFNNFQKLKNQFFGPKTDYPRKNRCLKIFKLAFLYPMFSVMIPLWMNLLGYQFLRGYNQQTTVRVPYHKICSSLVMLIIPLLIGVSIAKWKPSWGAKARKVFYFLAGKK